MLIKRPWSNFLQDTNKPTNLQNLINKYTLKKIHIYTFTDTNIDWQFTPFSFRKHCTDMFFFCFISYLQHILCLLCAVNKSAWTLWSAGRDYLVYQTWRTCTRTHPPSGAACWIKNWCRQICHADCGQTDNAPIIGWLLYHLSHSCLCIFGWEGQCPPTPTSSSKLQTNSHTFKWIKKRKHERKNTLEEQSLSVSDFRCALFWLV